MSNILKSLKNIKEQLNQLVNDEEVKSPNNVQPEKMMTSPLITCQKTLFRDNNINNFDHQSKIIEDLLNKNKELAAENRKISKKGTIYRKKIRELKSVNRNQRFVFMNKVDELERVNRFLKEELFASKESELELREEYNELHRIKNKYYDENFFLNKEKKQLRTEAHLGFIPNEDNGVLTNHHTTFNNIKVPCCLCCNDAYSYTSVCCGFGYCYQCLHSSYEKRIHRNINGKRLVVGYDCLSCGKPVSSSPEAINPIYRELNNWEDEGAEWEESWQ